MNNNDIRYKPIADRVNYQASIRIDKAKDYANVAKDYANIAEECTQKAEHCSQIVQELAEKLEQEIEHLTDTNFIYTQAISSSEWDIQHNLNKYPSVTVYDSSGNEVICDVKYIDKNNCKVIANAPFKGIASIN